MTALAVALAAAAGAVARHLVDQAVRARTRARRVPGFPWGTLVVNTTGSFALGVVVGLGLPDAVRTTAGTGFVGAYTTFSTFGLDVVRTAEDEEGGARRSGAYLVVSVVGGLVASAAGLAVTGGL